MQGWLLDLYPTDGGLALWLLEAAPDGGEGRRLRLWQPFPAVFYVAGPHEELRQLWRALRGYAAGHDVTLHLARLERRDLFQPQPLTVLAVTVDDPGQQPAVFAWAAAAFPGLTYYDADLLLPLRHAAACGTFPLAFMEVQADGRGRIEALHVRDSPWDLDPAPPPLRCMHLAPDQNPRRRAPQFVEVRCGRREYRFSLEPARPLLINLANLLRQFDPDLLLTAWGDTWLLPHLLEQSQQWNIPLPLNRDPGQPIVQRDERSYQAYGQVIYRGRQVLLAGRWHIDTCNAMMYHDYALEGVIESARVSGMPVQQAARLSPGTGISAMQIVTALRQGVLVPWHKQQAEQPKSVLELVRADHGGLVYQPTPGLHHDVAEIDFVSMYPSIMAHYNISPETIQAGPAPEETGQQQEQSTPQPDCRWTPELNLWVDTSRPGLVPQTLQPLLEKRIKLKQRIAELPAWDPRRKRYKAYSAAHKWLLVTCFGYLGYKNARFGRIEAHQAVTAYSRECLLLAKEAAEDAGYEVLHLYVDGLWVRKPGATTPQALQPLLDEITRRTGLPIALEGIYRWIVFGRSKTNPRWSVANRYFGAYQDGSLKLRGIEARRGDTAPFIAQTQLGILERLARSAQDDDMASHAAALEEALAFARQRLHRLRRGEVELEDLLVAQRVSQGLAEYRSPSPAARAARQLEAAGKPVRPGMSLRLLYLRGDRVQAWDCPPPPDPAQVDLPLYTRLLLRACASVLEPFGVDPAGLADRLLEGVQRQALPAPQTARVGTGNARRKRKCVSEISDILPQE